MHRYVIKRLLLLIPVIIGVSLFIFVALDLAEGDVTDILGGDELSEEQLHELRERLGLNEPLLVRYAKYMWGLLHGDLGISYITKQPVMDIYLQKLPATMKLATATCIVACALSIPLGIFAAKRHGSVADNIAMVGGLLGLSIPNFWLGLMLIIVFSLYLGWLPSQGDQGILSLILPAITVGTGHMATITRTTRSSMLDVIRSDYLRTARAKGVPEKQVINKHALRNALIPIITVVGAQYAASLGGATLTENVFSWPGLGRQLIDSMNSRDTQVVTGIVIMKTIMISVILLIVDILYAFVDPRIKSQYARGGKKKRG
jgi:peptide/nickel transport system permease protein